MKRKSPPSRTVLASLGTAALGAATLLAVFDSQTLNAQMHNLQSLAVEITILDDVVVPETDQTTRDIVDAAEAFMASLDDAQSDQAVVGLSPINLVLGPGEYGTSVIPEGLQASVLNDAQQELLLDVIEARLGFMNADDFGAAMDRVRAELDDTWFGWWGPEGVPGGAYFRVTAPSYVLEYSPQDMGGDPTDHAHNMYRDTENDYDAAWISPR